MEQSAEFRLYFSGELLGDTGTLSLIDHLQGRRKETLMFKIVCQQALHLGDFVKSTHARGTREEKRQRGVGIEDGFAACTPFLARLAYLAQMKSLLAGKFTTVEAQNANDM